MPSTRGNLDFFARGRGVTDGRAGNGADGGRGNGAEVVAPDSCIVGCDGDGSAAPGDVSIIASRTGGGGGSGVEVGGARSCVSRGRFAVVSSGRDITVLKGSNPPVTSEGRSRDIALVGASSSICALSMRIVSP